MYDDDLGAVDAEVGDTGCLAQDVLRHAAVASLVILLKVSRLVFLKNCVKLIPTSTLKIVWTCLSPTWNVRKVKKKRVCRIMLCVYFAKFCVDVLASAWP